jgi:beta-galactosidase/beta-glucuronidase
MKKAAIITGAIFYASCAYSQTAGASRSWEPAGNKIKTHWAEKVDPQNILPEYPRPQLERAEWLSLNGLWEYTITPVNAQASPSSGAILVPFPVESSLSGVRKRLNEGDTLRYERTFTVPKAWAKKSIILHFGAVDWQATVFLNGKKVGEHTGGYTPFQFDITPFLTSGEQKLTVVVLDPTDSGYQPRGKQMKQPAAIFYSAVSGIWQTVWIEPVEKKRITAVYPVADIDRSELTLTIPTENTTAKTERLEVVLKAGKQTVAKGSFAPEQLIKLSVPNAQLWSPEHPFLYDVEVKLYDGSRQVDYVKSYAAMRKISIVSDASDMDDRVRIQLNNADYFQCGILDQGYWPDGLYTAPADEAMLYDIQKAKDWGFSLIRKHLKVEPARWYAHCDRLGMLVWQDMPSGDFGRNTAKDAPAPTQVQTIKTAFSSTGKSPADSRSIKSAVNFRREWQDVVDFLKPFSSVIVWTIFSEGWGQFDAEEIARWTKSYDSTRLVNPAGGAMFVEVGDLLDIHQYPIAKNIPKDRQRAVVLGGYGGITASTKGHQWQPSGHFGHAYAKEANEVTRFYTEYAEALAAFIDEGLAAVVYTQLTDIEGELNGLMTYDRKVVKIDEAKIREANEKLKKTYYSIK